ncbi:MAG: InlB B-repeat-containing protein [Clostridia bacterium]|nr:InlB B-repeat-containing protein [Clostridia bacterium]
MKRKWSAFAFLLALSMSLGFGLTACGGETSFWGNSSSSVSVSSGTQSESEESSASVESSASESVESSESSEAESSSQSSATSYTVTFEGENVDILPQTVKEGGKVIEPKEPEREGYIFDGWYNGETAFDFSIEITESITLTAKWKEGDTMLGKGTKDEPYTISNAAQLLDFSAKVNAGTEGYDKAYYALTADIDMTGVDDFVPVGKTTVDEDDNVLDYTFKGAFDGNGYTVSNLTIEKIIKRGVGYVGLFGETAHAQIKNVTLDNFAYTVESYSSDATVGASIGGVVGYADLTEFTNVTAKGTITTGMMEANNTHIGGLAGSLHVSMENNQAYVVYVENCYVDLTTALTEDGAHESGSVGGLFGYVHTYESAVAIINCATAGSLRGGMCAGGLAGSISNYVSIINCTSSASVRGLASEVTYAGGLVGQCLYDAVIMDSYASGSVTGKQASSSTYQSYVGGIIGYGKSNDYVQYYTPGTAVINCYYGGKITTNRAEKNTLGTEIAKEDVTPTFLKETLGWEEECWTFGDTVVPSNKTAKEVSETYTVTLKSKGQTVKELTYTYSPNVGYEMFSELSPLEHQSPELFYAWEMADGENTRFYLPVMKDLTITARWQDVTAIVGAYKGTGLLNDAGTPIDAGSFVLDDEGGVQWIRQSVATGSYTYDGEHIHFIIGANGEQTGILTGTSLTFEEDAGITGYVSYSFAKYNPAILGEFVSNTGDILTVISEEKISFQSTQVKSGDFISANYTLEGDLITVNTDSSERISSYFSAFTIDISNPKQIIVNATPKTAGEYALTDKAFDKISAIDYSGKAFLGEYNLAYVSGSSSNRYGVETFTVDNYKLHFLKNGTVIYESTYTLNPGRYYYSEINKTVKIVLDGYACEFTFDESKGIFYGAFVRSETLKLPMVLTPVADGALSAYAYGDRYTVLFVTENGDYYFIDNKVYDQDATIVPFDANGRVVINGDVYQRMVYQTPDESRIYCNLLLLGEEEGTYTLGGKTFHLDGVGGVTGDKTGKYYVYDSLVVVLCDNDEMFGFDFAAAKAANGAAVKAETDGNEGIWYLDGEDYSTGEPKPKYYKVVIDGYGNATLLYLYQNSEYHFNWGGWGTYTCNGAGVTIRFNQYHSATFTKYYDGQLLYTKSTSWLYGECGFYQDGYTGTMTPPAFNAQWAGSYADQADETRAAIFNVRADMTGSYKGYPISSVIFDGDKTLYFSANGENYQVTFGSTITLTGETENITLTYAGAVTEVFPAVLVGTWTGEFSGYGVVSGEQRAITLETDGTVKYSATVGASGTELSQVEYDSTTNVITAFMTNGGITFELVYDSENEQIHLTMSDKENREWTATLTKQA